MSPITTKLRDMFVLAVLVLLMAVPGLGSLPVIDRDEARYAQASVQMLESGDFVNIRFQDRARNKKPAGAYWAQALSVRAFSDPAARQIWAHRLPSVLAGLLAVLATYLAGIRLVGRESAFYGAAFLAVSFMFVFEAHIAKTDAILLGFSSLSLAALARLRQNGNARGAAVLFWFALGCAVMVKGPILPVLLLLCLGTLTLWEREAGWLRKLLFWPGPILFLAIVLPWTVLIWRATDGTFFTEAFARDLAPKLQGAQEKHPGPPGYYLLSTWLAFWPSALFLLPGLVFGVRAALNKNTFNSTVSRTARLLLCWSVPFFLMLELVPTKLPHYTLPVFPAFALLSGAALATLIRVDEFRLSRRIGAGIFILVTLLLGTAVLSAQALYGDFPSWQFASVFLTILTALYGGARLWRAQAKSAFWAALIAAGLLYIPTYQFVLPNLDRLQVAGNVRQTLLAHHITLPVKDRLIYSAQFTEPSLVYYLGTHIQLADSSKPLKGMQFHKGDIILIDRKKPLVSVFENALKDRLAEQKLCTRNMDHVRGFNYAKGDEVALDIREVTACPISTTAPARPDATPATRPDP